jgi:hypothetical protein
MEVLLADIHENGQKCRQFNKFFLSCNFWEFLAKKNLALYLDPNLQNCKEF